jgi:hypothetical protein
LFKRSIAWSQYTFSARSAAERDHIADLHVLAVDDHAFDEQLNQSAALSEGSAFETFGDSSPEVLDARRDRLQVVSLNSVGLVLLSLTRELGEAALKLATSRLELLQSERVGLIGIDESLDAASGLQLPSSQVPSLRLPLTPAEPAFAEPLHGILQHGGFTQDLAQVLPHERVDASSGYLTSVARLPPTAVGQHIHAAAAVVRIAAVVPDVHGQSTPPATQQTAEKILALCVAHGPVLIAL